jgi:hypothetical protein
MEFSADLVLKSYGINYYRYYQDGHGRGTMALSDEELRKLNLSKVENYKPQ